MSHRWWQQLGKPLAIFLSMAVVANSGAWISGADPRAQTAYAAEAAAPSAQSSLQLAGTTAFAEVAAASDLNLPADWTVELWFRDDDPLGFDHDYRYLVNKGDGVAPESPYYLVIGNGSLGVGARSQGVHCSITYNLKFAGYSARIWQHVAASFQASTTMLTLYLNGMQVAQERLNARSTGNAMPLQIGREGQTPGKYFLGKIDDLRLWNVVRSAGDIRANYRRVVGVGQPGLIANWLFDDRAGSVALDAAGMHPATLIGGATFSTDVPELGGPPPSSRTPTATPTRTATPTPTSTPTPRPTTTAAATTHTPLSTPTRAAVPMHTPTPAPTLAEIAMPNETPTPSTTTGAPTVQANGPVGDGWVGTTQVVFFIPQFCITPTRAHVVTITFPDGTAFKFQPTLGSLSENGCTLFPRFLMLGYQALPGTSASLAPLNGNHLITSGGFQNSPIRLLDQNTLEVADPTRFRLTLSDGREFVIDRAVSQQNLTLSVATA
jgi:Concanavalin A-like lectin/glucanases superfamily